MPFQEIMIIGKLSLEKPRLTRIMGIIKFIVTLMYK